jgi:hypothetical protein
MAFQGRASSPLFQGPRSDFFQTIPPGCCSWIHRSKRGASVANRRAEMWSHLKTALEGAHFSLPDSDSLQTDICGPGFKYMSDGRLVLESKDDMKKRGMQSPDEGDAVALCFSEPDGRL